MLYDKFKQVRIREHKQITLQPRVGVMETGATAVFLVITNNIGQEPVYDKFRIYNSGDHYQTRKLLIRYMWVRVRRHLVTVKCLSFNIQRA